MTRALGLAAESVTRVPGESESCGAADCSARGAVARVSFLGCHRNGFAKVEHRPHTIPGNRAQFLVGICCDWITYSFKHW